MTARTYASQAEWQAAQAEAMAEFRRTGVFSPPVPAALAAHEAVRYGPAPFGVTRPDPPAPAARPAVTGEQVAAVVREAVAVVGDAQAQSLCARRLNEAGADPATVSAAMCRVQAEREVAAERDVANLRPALRDPGLFR
jgi:hypothetical protein